MALNSVKLGVALHFFLTYISAVFLKGISATGLMQMWDLEARCNISHYYFKKLKIEPAV